MSDMKDDLPKQATKEDLRRGRRRCWCPDCPNTAFFEDWSGWHWCVFHAWREIWSNETLEARWFEFRRMKIRNPY